MSTSSIKAVFYLEKAASTFVFIFIFIFMEQKLSLVSDTCWWLDSIEADKQNDQFAICVMAQLLPEPTQSPAQNSSPLADDACHRKY